MFTLLKKLGGVVVLGCVLVPAALTAVPSAQALTSCSSTTPCLPQNASFSTSIPAGGVAFNCQTTSGTYNCLQGVALGTSGTGVYGYSPGATGVKGEAGGFGYGGMFNATNGWGVYATTQGSGYGGYFSTGAGGTGVWAQSGGGSGLGYGVQAQSYSSADNAAGVYGAINSSADYTAGVHGFNASTSCCGFGVVGFHAGQGIGIGGYAPNGFGVFGFSPYNWAAWLDGAVQVTKDLHVSGTLFKGAGAFRIDNPLDPAHSYLQHSFVESPDMKNIYDGVARTNAKGFATVQLPKWFQALNKDFRYQLTSLSGLQQVAVAQEIRDNRFVIQSQKPNSRISWQVTGIRHDRYANANRIQLVVPKTGSDAGKYEHPRLYGQPASKGVTALPAALRYSKQAAAAAKTKTK